MGRQACVVVEQVFIIIKRFEVCIEISPAYCHCADLMLPAYIFHDFGNNENSSQVNPHTPLGASQLRDGTAAEDSWKLTCVFVHYLPEWSKLLTASGTPH